MHSRISLTSELFNFLSSYDKWITIHLFVSNLLLPRKLLYYMRRHPFRSTLRYIVEMLNQSI